MPSFDNYSNPNYNQFMEKKLVDIYMASLYRQAHCVKSIESLLKNPEVGTINLTCNSYTDSQFEEVCNKIAGLNSIYNIPIYIHRHDNEKKSNEKLRYLKKGSNYYICFADDDLVYPPNYLAYMIQGCEKYNAYVSLHGAILQPRPLQSYYRNRQVFRGLKSVPMDVKVDIASNCGSLFKRNFFAPDYLAEWYERVGYESMDDIWCNFFAKRTGIPRYVLAHEEGFIVHKQQFPEDNYVFDAHALVAGGDKPMTDFINNYWDK
jgi:hypothetical protein